MHLTSAQKMSYMAEDCVSDKRQQLCLLLFPGKVESPPLFFLVVVLRPKQIQLQ